MSKKVNVNMSVRPDHASSEVIATWNMNKHEKGAMVWDTTEECLKVWDGSIWAKNLSEGVNNIAGSIQGYYSLLSGFYFGGVATETIITVAETNQWIDVIMTVDSAGVFDYRTNDMKAAQASGHTGDGSDGSPLVFDLEGLTLSATASIRAAMTFDPDEDGGRFESKLLFTRHSGATPSGDFEIASSALVIESGADLDYSHTPNTQFFIGDTIDTNGAGDAGTVRLQIKTDVAGTLSMREIALFIQS